MRLRSHTLNYSGIDEAGLGPILGPFCATSITMSAPEEPGVILKDLQGKLFTVDDSKKIYKTKSGLKKLEYNVLAFYYLLNKEIPGTLQDFIPSLLEPWYKEPLKMPLNNSTEEIIDASNKIKEEFNKRDINLLDIKRSAVSARNFNLLIDKFDNKSVVIQKIMDPLIFSAIKHPKTNKLVIDKQGGRKFYKDYLADLIGTTIDIISEENNSSLYSYNNGTIEFRAKADSSSFNVALASMFSKYMREISMKSFNNYWRDKNKDIKATAGYYTDGMRFIKDLEESLLLPKSKDQLIRKK